MNQVADDLMRRRLRRESLRSSIDRLTQSLGNRAPGHEREWARGLADALGRADAVLRERLAAAHEQEGALAEVDVTIPALARQVGDICRAETDLINDIDALKAELERAQTAFAAPNAARQVSGKGIEMTPVATVVDLNDLRTRTEYLVTILQAIDTAEVQLIQESINRDTGVGD